jgi:hypothetical protein
LKTANNLAAIEFQSFIRYCTRHHHDVRSLLIVHISIRESPP